MEEGEERCPERESVDAKRRAIRSLTAYMLALSVVQGLLGSLSILLLHRCAPSVVLTTDPAVRGQLLALLPHVAAQMVLVSATLVSEALVVGAGRFGWLAAGTAASSVVAVARMRGAGDLVGIWNEGIVALFLGRLLLGVAGIARHERMLWLEKIHMFRQHCSP